MNYDDERKIKWGSEQPSLGRQRWEQGDDIDHSDGSNRDRDSAKGKAGSSGKSLRKTPRVGATMDDKHRSPLNKQKAVSRVREPIPVFNFFQYEKRQSF